MKDVTFKIHQGLKNTDVVMEDTFWIGLHPGLNEKHLEYSVNILIDFFAKINK
jgi:CDP-6-deoxy-D-xylo-4-hexulose-3-dehydrase